MTMHAVHSLYGVLASGIGWWLSNILGSPLMYARIVGLFRLVGGVVLVRVIVLKRRLRASWRHGGMCFRTRPEISSQPATLWFGVRRRAFCIIVREMRSTIIRMEMGGGVGKACANHGNGAPGERY